MMQKPPPESCAPGIVGPSNRANALVPTSRFRSVHLLAYLRDLARRGGGYELRGVRGWAPAADVGDATGAFGAGDDLRSLAARGELIRADVSVPDATTPVWVYRIIPDDTARLLAEL